MTPGDHHTPPRITPWRTLRFAWRSRWNALRALTAALLLIALLLDTGPRLARLQLGALPEFDYLAEVRHLREAGRFGEAIVVADAGLDVAQGPAREALAAERETIIAERQSILRRLRAAGMGAVSGQADSLEGLAGAIAADFFLIGDLRDLVIQGGRYVADGETDEVILLLSGLGVATTLAPQIDWAPALLKAARKAGSLTRGMSESIVHAVRGRQTERVRAILADTAVVAERASPGGALRLLRHADDPADLAAIARYVERSPRGAFALHITGKEGVTLLRAGDAGAAARAGDDLLLLAARKGRPGGAWLRSGNARLLLRPHPLVGLAKGLWKGNLERGAQRLLAAAAPHAAWLIPLLGAWLFIEGGLLVRRAVVMLGPAPPERAASRR